MRINGCFLNLKNITRKELPRKLCRKIRNKSSSIILNDWCIFHLDMSTKVDSNFLRGIDPTYSYLQSIAIGKVVGIKKDSSGYRKLHIYVEYSEHSEIVVYDDSKSITVIDKEIAELIYDKLIIPLNETSPKEVDLKSLAKVIDRLVSRAYPNNEVDVTVIARTTIGIMIKFPKLTIRNSSGLEHELLDVYSQVIFKTERQANFKETGGHILRYQGYKVYRGLVTKEEIAADYSHSHLPGFNPGNYCFGGTYNGIGRIIQDASSKGVTILNLISFMYNLTAALSWESLEGTPYRTISSIGNTNRHRSYSSSDLHLGITLGDRDRIHRRYLPALFSNLKEEDIDYEISGTSVKLSDSFKDKIETILSSHAENSDLYLHEDSIPLDENNNSRLTYAKAQQVAENFYVITFKGKSFRPRVVQPQETIDKTNKTLNVFIIQYCILQLEHEIKSHITEEIQ